MVLDASLLNTQHYKVRIKGKVEQSREGVAPSPTPWCSSYRKGSLRVTLDYGRQLYFTFYYLNLISNNVYIYIYIYIYIMSCSERGFSTLSLYIRQYRPFHSEDLQDYTPCLYRGVVEGFCSSVWSSPQENVTYKLALTSPAVSCMSWLSDLKGFRDERSVTV